MPDPEQERREAFLREENNFRTNAFLLVDKMVELAGQAPGVTALLDEIIHSIFFLGSINSPPFSLENILGDTQNDLRLIFPQPFRLFASHVPRRSPFSCVLDMIVQLRGRENESAIIDGLRELIDDLGLGQSNHLVSTTICVSQNNRDPVKYYGVSISASGRNYRRIMIAASCLGNWDRYVAGAVMTYLPKKKRYFDGTIHLPNGVRCEAFSLRNVEAMPPCAICGKLFGLTPFNEEKTDWPYGNCAEVESLSNLFKNVDDDSKRTWLTSETNYDGLRVRAEREVQRVLLQYLNWPAFTFYTPQEVSS